MEWLPTTGMGYLYGWATNLWLGFLRGAASLLLVIAGVALSVFSIAVAFGWDRGPFSLAGTIIAIFGLSLIFLAYWLVRDTDGAPLAATCLKLTLASGSTFLIIGLLSVFLPGDIGTPTGYFLATGCGCALGLIKFHAYTSRITS